MNWAFNGGLRYAFGVAPAAAAGQFVPAPVAAPTRSYLVFLDWDKATLTDPARRERAVFWLLAAYCAVWSLYGAFAKGSQDIHFDMGEMVAWSRDAGIGTLRSTGATKQ